MSDHTITDEPQVGLEGAKFGMWLFLLTEVLLFGGLFTAYTVFRAIYPQEFHTAHLELSKVIGGINTIVLICSSLTMALAVWSVQRDKLRLTKIFLFLTILQGFIFLVNKVFEYSAKISHGIYPNSSYLLQLPTGERLFFSIYYTLTGLHGLHVLGGVIVLIFILRSLIKNRYSSTSYGPVEIAGLYWHFVDLIWIYLFPLLYLIG